MLFVILPCMNSDAGIGENHIVPLVDGLVETIRSVNLAMSPEPGDITAGRPRPLEFFETSTLTNVGSSFRRALLQQALSRLCHQ